MLSLILGIVISVVGLLIGLALIGIGLLILATKGLLKARERHFSALELIFTFFLGRFIGKKQK